MDSRIVWSMFSTSQNLYMKTSRRTALCLVFSFSLAQSYSYTERACVEVRYQPLLPMSFRVTSLAPGVWELPGTIAPSASEVFGLGQSGKCKLYLAIYTLCGPFHWRFFNQSQFKWMEISFSDPKLFCTYDSCAVVACPKLIAIPWQGMEFQPVKRNFDISVELQLKSY